MSWLLPFGIVLTLAGIALLGWCIWRAMRLRALGLSEQDLKAGLMRVVAVNLAALGLSGLGLMAVILGLVLG